MDELLTNPFLMALIAGAFGFCAGWKLRTFVNEIITRILLKIFAHRIGQKVLLETLVKMTRKRNR